MIGAVLAQAATNCPRTTPDCDSSLARKPLLEGFGVHELFVIGGAVLATLVGLIVVAWLLVVLTGANRDYDLSAPDPNGSDVQVMAAQPASGPTTPLAPPRRSMPSPLIRPSTWVATGVVLAGVIAVATWIALGGEPDAGTGQIASSTTLADGAASTVLGCTTPPLQPSFLPEGYAFDLVAGFGSTAAVIPGCYYHWQGPDTGAITILPAGSPYAPRNEDRAPTVVDGHTLFVGPTLQGAIGVVFEEREIGGAPDIWYTLVSSSVSQDDLLRVAAGLTLRS